jgi:ankyrin repeat protein
MTRSSLAFSFLCVSAAAPLLILRADIDANQPTADDYLRAIRANDLATLTSLCKTNPATVRDRLDYTPLHYAAVYGSTEAVRTIINAGGDPNARNKTESTPLMYAAWSLERTRLLVEKGGDVNAKATDGSTPLSVALGVPDNEATVHFLVDKGADVKLLTAGGADYLERAAARQDVSILRLFLDKGLDPHRADKSGTTALIVSLRCDGGAKARLLIASGADVNAFDTDAGKVKNGPIESTGETPLMDAAVCGETSVVADLIKAGARLDTTDTVRHMTALMRAVAMDGTNPETVSLLISSGASLDIADRFGETALDWARKFRNPAVVGLLEKAGAKEKGLSAAPVRPADYHPSAQQAVVRASTLLATSNIAFFREGGGCTGCHHQPFAGRAFAALKSAGLTPDPRLRQILVDAMVADSARMSPRLPLMLSRGGGLASFTYPLAGLAEMGEPANEFTDLVVHFVAEGQEASGAWNITGSRAPLQESSISATMLSVSALKSYGWPARRAEFDDRIFRAKTWLLQARAVTTVEEADRLLGLWLAGAPAADIRSTAETLLARQHTDGGWAQTPYLDSDAYGTGAVLDALRRTGFLKPSDPAYQKAAQFLLNTQFPDGSWYVRSRAVKLQPYFQSEFPYGHDQWISNSATAYAVMALAPVAGASR